MVFILFTMSCVAANSLEMTLLDRTNPDLVPCRRNYERLDARQGCWIAQEPSLWSKIAEGLPRADTPYAGHAIDEITESGDLRRRDGIRCSQSHINFDGTSKTSRDTFVRTGETWKYF